MAAIRSKGMKPEMAVRSLAHKLGFRFRLHRRDLPGAPDLVFPSKKKVIFVHGCFWHQHSECREGRMPGTRREYWVPKLQRNMERDARNAELLREAGWQVLTVWECEIKDLPSVRQKLSKFLKA